ncbi:hypothetical protein KIN20_033672 [Parelaphostrongylus tenuis]|uniref:Uncharacterized protein n=1 Tax=Parelaphostrongylus tenuis TaxID=148309 RepID=A0AAD5R8R0_PARTN|nr:hypothetical protein KIN20_033672 [Parelaphostrongylus tenuis]
MFAQADPEHFESAMNAGQTINAERYSQQLDRCSQRDKNPFFIFTQGVPSSSASLLSRPYTHNPGNKLSLYLRQRSNSSIDFVFSAIY